MLKSFLLFAAVVLLMFTCIPVPAQDKGAAKGAPDAQAKAKKLYDLDCALCHGATGNGKTDLAKDMELNLADWTDPKTLARHIGSGAFRCDSQRQRTRCRRKMRAAPRTMR